MFEPWYGRRDEEEATRFWFEFQVISDGFEDDKNPEPNHGNIADTDWEVTTPAIPHTAAAPDSHENLQFHFFPQLPAELRLKIWSCLIRPRIVLAACLSSRPSTANPLTHQPKRPFVPVLLHICSESRELALKHYELAFSWKLPHRLRASSPSYAHHHPPSHSQSRHTLMMNPTPPSPSSSSSTPPVPPVQLPPPPPPAETAHPARVYFNFALDTLFLRGELEPFDGHGFNAPMVYFLRREDTARVRRVACALRELHLGLVDTELVFATLFHVVDRFPSARGGGLVSHPHLPLQRGDGGRVGDGDGDGDGDAGSWRGTRAGLGGGGGEGGDGDEQQFLIVTATEQDADLLPKNHHQQQLLSSLPTTDNVIQKLWRAWAMGSGYWPGRGGGVEPPSSSSPVNSLENIQMVMVREEELAGFVARIQ